MSAVNYQPMPYQTTGIGPAGKPNPATAIIAGILAVLGAVMATVSAIGDLVVLQRFSAGLLYVELVLNVLMVCALASGALLVFLRKPLGQWVVAAGCVLGLARSVLTPFSAEVLHMSARSATTGAILGALPPIATLLLVLLPLTSRYLGWTPGFVAPQQFPPQGAPPRQAYGWQAGVAAQPFAPQPVPPQGGRPPLGTEPPAFQPQQPNLPQWPNLPQQQQGSWQQQSAFPQRNSPRQP